MKFGSVCSGIEAASVAWQPLGWKAQWFSEIEPFPCALLKHHYPTTPNLGDMTQFESWPTDDQHAIDLLCGGTPCQSFSVAGLRAGLDDPRGNLMLTFGAIAAKYRPQWLVWENVPGVLSSNGGRDFGTFLGMLGQLGYGFAYRVLDAQYFGVAQRRRRVFVVGYFGDWRRAAAVLFERHSLQGHPAPSRQAGKVAPTIPSRSTAGGGLGTDFDLDGGVIQAFGGNNQSGPIDVATARNACASASGRMDFETETFLVQPTHTLRGEGFDTSEDGTGRGTPLVPHVVGALACNTGPNGHDAGNFACNQAVDAGHVLPVAYGIRTANTSSNGWGIQEECTHTLDCAQGVAVAFTTEQTPKFNHECALTLTKQSPTGGGQFQSVMHAMQVRRLTPTEAEKLQGFEPGYTAIPWRKKPASECPDGPRYKALGNSWAVPNVRWIGGRIDMVDQIHTLPIQPQPLTEMAAAA